jgi:hypothetical protein
MDPDYVLADTRLEFRDGATWVSGLCPSCWERLAFHAPPRGSTAQVRCPNGHLLEISDQTSEGGSAYAQRSCSGKESRAAR